MKIIFDARVLGEYMHGIARYCLHLLRQLLAKDRGDEYLILISHSKIQEWFTSKVSVRWLSTSIPLYSMQEQIMIPIHLRREVFDFFHSPTFTIPLLFSPKGIITIHDLIPMLFPEDYGLSHRLFFRFVVRRAVARCQKVFTVSEQSKNDIITLLQGKKERLVVTPNGLDPHWGPKTEEPAFSRRYGLDLGYFVFVGNPKPHKNFPRVLSAFELLIKDDSYPGKLVAIGIPPGNLSADLKDRVLFLPQCNDQDLSLFYSGADLLVAPSLYEGFGLPVLEAMACGCPILIGNQGALPEIAGDAGFQVNPYDIHAIKEGIWEILHHQDLRQDLRERGLKQAKQYSWEKTARIVLETYDSLRGFSKHQTANNQ
jgi:glycosyltransferase involved in cell wall biosynthesis